MGTCFSEEKSLEEIMKNGFLTKVYNFDGMKLKEINTDDLKGDVVKNVHVFSAKNNYLKFLPNNFLTKIDKISKIDLSYNNFTNIDELLFRFSKSLIYLNLSNNQIKEITPSIQALEVITELNLSNNQIQEIPKEFCSLTKLETLSLSNNKISVFPDEVYLMPKLSFVALDHNNIALIPDKNWNKSNILKLDLSFNEIKAIPNDILENSKISRLYLKGNNGLTTAELRDCPGYENYLKRRKDIKDKGFEHNLDISFSQCGLD